MPETGQTISHYQILEKLGEGGMGVVYKGRDTKLDRVVALKFLPQRLNSSLANQPDKSRFLQEAKSASALNHPNICTIYYLEEVGAEHFIVMEYVDGATLRDRIPVKNVQDAVAIAIQVGEAIHEAHGKGVVHRDIKSDNIMLNARGQVKVMDFGLAKIKGSLKLTRSSSTVGTLAYMAPEQIRGEEVDPRSDIFSFGVVLFEMLTGAFPFKGEHEAAVMYSVLNEEPEPLEKYRPDAPQALSALIARCLEKDAADRYQHADDLVSELRRIQKQSTRVSRPSQPVPRATEPDPPAVAAPTASAVRPPSQAELPGVPAAAEQPAAPRKRSRALVTGAAAALVVLATAGYFLFGPKTGDGGSAEGGRKMLVVLPFENLGAPDQEYFADGVTEEITGKLSGLSGLGVIARTSAVQYKKTTKTMKEIGAELGVGYVLQGTIRWGSADGGAQRVRVSPALIKVSDGTQVWSESYDAVLSDVFTMQASIASEVASAMGVALLKPEEASLKTVSTTNSEAYDYYLRGVEYRHRSYQKQELEIASEMFQKAIELDPTFALAHARLAEIHFGIYWFFYDHTENRLAMGKSEVDRALEIDPNLPEAHFSLGYYYYWGRLDYDNALKEFRKYAEAKPNSGEIHLAIGAVQRRQGKMEDAVASITRASELDPRSTEDAYNLAQTLTLLRRYAEAEKVQKRAISLSPELSTQREMLLTIYLLRDGNTRAAREAMRDAEGIFGREKDDILRFRYVQIEGLDGNYQKAIDLVEGATLPAIDNQFSFAPRQLLLGQIYTRMGNPARARAYFDSARTILQARIQERPDDARYYSALGIAYAGLGKREEAIANGKRGIEILPVSKEAWRGGIRIEEMARIYAMTGDADPAVAELERLLSIPSMMSKQLVQADPTFAGLRENPRFKKLVSGS